MNKNSAYLRLRERWILCSDMIDSYEKRIHELKTTMRLIEDKFLIFQKPPPRGYIKKLISAALINSEHLGVSPDEIVSLAASDKLLVKRETVASMLSRMKANGQVYYEKGRYHPR